jgi:hypothetical protein
LATFYKGDEGATEHDSLLKDSGRLRDADA